MVGAVNCHARRYTGSTGYPQCTARYGRYPTCNLTCGVYAGIVVYTVSTVPELTDFLRATEGDKVSKTSCEVTRDM